MGPWQFWYWAVMPRRWAVAFIRWTKAASVPEMYSAMATQLAEADGIRISLSRVSTVRLPP